MSGVKLSDLLDNNNIGYSLDDLIVLPGMISSDVDAINVQSPISKHIKLNIPIVSSPMDTVTEHKMAICMALHGGIGIIHCKMTAEEQADEVRLVKRYNNGFIYNPVTVDPNDTIGTVRKLAAEHGFYGFPVVSFNTLVGLVSRRDIDFQPDDKIVREVMTPYDKLIVGEEGCTLEAANKIIVDTKISRLPIADANRKLLALISRKDIRNNIDYPLALKSHRTKQLLVGAAVTTALSDRDRIDHLAAAGVDLIVIDSAQGCSQYQIDTLKYCKENYPNIDVIGGNVVTEGQARILIENGVDGLRVGMGIGSICTTQTVCGIGRAQVNAIHSISSIGKGMMYPVPIIADGGLSNTGKIFKALAIGANCVMLGSMLASTDESPGKIVYRDGVKLKEYRGMGSHEVLNSSKNNRYLATVKVAQGVKGTVVSIGSLNDYMPKIIQAVKQAVQYSGASSLKNLHDCVQAGNIGFELMSVKAQRDGGVHDLYSYENDSI